MTWFKVDDKLAGHDKARRAGLKAMGLWCMAGAQAAGYLTNGYVSRSFVEGLRGLREAEILVDVGLWHPAEGGWVFHEWEQSNPTRAQVEARREADRKRKNAWRNP